MRWLRRLSKAVLLTTTLTVVVVGTGLFWTLGTESGSRWLLGQILEPETGDIRYRQVEGTLWRGLALADLSVSLPTATLRLERVQGKWQLWNLLGGELVLDRLAAGPGELVLREVEGTATGGPDWPDLTPPLPVEIRSLTVEQFRVHQGEASWLLHDARLSARLGLRRLRLSDLALNLARGEQRYRARARGHLANRYPYGGQLQLDWYVRAAESLTLSGEAGIRGDMTRLQLEHQLSQPRRVHSQGELILADSAGPLPRIDLLSQWRDLPLAAPDGTSLAADGQVRLRGHWQDYQLEGSNTLVVAEEEPGQEATGVGLLRRLPEPLETTLEASGDPGALNLAQLELTSGDMALTAQGDLDWREGLSWQLDLAAADLDTGLVYPALPARLSGKGRAVGFLRDEDFRARFELETVSGTLAGHRIGGSGEVVLRPSRTEISDVELTLGEETRLAGNGQLADGALSLQWQLHAPELAALGESFGGQLESTGSAQGRWPDLRLDLSLQGRNLRLMEWRAGELELSLAPGEGDGHRIQLSGRELAGGGLAGLDLEANGSGAVADHQVEFDWRHPAVRGKLALSGGYAQGVWDGQLEKARLENRLAGEWQLGAPAPLALAGGEQRIGRFCLERAETHLCASGQHSEDGLRGEGELRALDLALASPMLADNTAVEGLLDGEFQVSGRYPDLTGQFHLATREAALTLTAGEEEDRASERQPLTLTLDGALAQRRLQAEGEIALSDNGQLTLGGGWPLEKDAGEPEAHLKGQLQRLDWLQGLIPGVNKLQGQLDADLALTGDADRPRPEGELRLSRISARIPAVGIELREGDGRLALNAGGQWQLEASAVSGDNPLHIDGEGALGDDGFTPRGEVRVSGDRVLLLDQPDRRALVSPDLRLTFDPQAFALAGDLVVPEGKLVIKELSPGATRVSPDEEILGTEEDTDQRSGLDWRADLRLLLGDEVHFEGFGLTARPTGDLRLRQQRGEPAQAFGTLRLMDGVYSAYGQSLQITQGYLLFRGPPENPALNIVAEREAAGYRVGIEVHGYARDIRSEIFSEPPLPPTEALAVLVTGKPVNELNSGDANRVMNTATALGIANSAWITSRLQGLFGIDVFTFEGGDDYLDSSLVVGKYLSPRLLISYVQNLFTPESHVALRYRLTDKLELKAESGESQSLDLLYQIEH